ncbi:hypothetical protein ACE14D_03200 [Streptomyces sp. Act-28]
MDHAPATLAADTGDLFTDPDADLLAVRGSALTTGSPCAPVPVVIRSPADTVFGTNHSSSGTASRPGHAILVQPG